MKLPTTALMALLLGAVVLCQIFYLALLSSSEKRGGKKSLPDLTRRSPAKISNKNVVNRVFRTSETMIDASGQYRIRLFYAASRAIETGHRVAASEVTLVTQTSPHNIHYLVGLATRWSGPISVAIFSSDEGLLPTADLITKLRHCFEPVRQNVSFHLVSPIRLDDRLQAYNSTNSGALECGSLLSELGEPRPDVKNYALADKAAYPVNLLRNVALQASITDFIFVVDVDMLPSAGLNSAFSRFVQEKGEEKTAYVVPAFESMTRFPVPESKSQLLAAIEEGVNGGQNVLRQFYKTVCYKCQMNTDYTKWMEMDRPWENNQSLNIAYNVNWLYPWEPFYISERHLPRYEERFKQYGFNRVSQICEMHMAGYTFSILDTAFVVHQEFKKAEAFHPSKQADHQANKQLFLQFKEELVIKYPDTDRYCYVP